jgi:hypothetical protein
LERGESVYGADIDGALRRLNELTSRIDTSQGPDDLLRDPALGEARFAAAEILRALNSESG